MYSSTLGRGYVVVQGHTQYHTLTSSKIDLLMRGYMVHYLPLFTCHVDEDYVWKGECTLSNEKDVNCYLPCLV